MKTPIPLTLSLTLLLSLLPPGLVRAADYKQIIIDPTYEHDRWNTKPKDVVRIFEAYMVSFDGEDDDSGDGQPDAWGIPEWVAYEIRAVESDPGAGPARPNTWIHDKNLAARKLDPKDDTYRGSGYDRGHMCQKYVAWRLGTNADWNTHTTLNACPQVHGFNAGIWLDMEEKTQKWADEYGKIWVICGPVISNKTVKTWIADPGEINAALPDAFFKIIVKQSNPSDKPDVLAFLYPHQDIPKKGSTYDHLPYLVTVDDIEAATGLDFLTDLKDDVEQEVEKDKPTALWSISE